MKSSWKGEKAVIFECVEIPKRENKAKKEVNKEFRDFQRNRITTSVKTLKIEKDMEKTRQVFQKISDSKEGLNLELIPKRR